MAITSSNSTMALVLAAGLLMLAFVFSSLAYYNAYVYKADVAKDWLDMAKVSNNLANTNKDISQAIDILQNYHGSPLIFTSPNTNYDVIRANLEQVLKTNTQFNTADSMPYQQLVANHKTILDNAIGDLGNANFDWMWNPALNYVLLIFMVIVIPVLIIAAQGPEVLERRRLNQQRNGLTR